MYKLRSKNTRFGAGGQLESPAVDNASMDCNYDAETDRQIDNTKPCWLFSIAGDTFTVWRAPATNANVSPSFAIMFRTSNAGALTVVSLLSAEAWGTPTLTNSWVNFDAVNEEVAGYRKQADGMVLLKGYLKSGVVGSGTPMFTLPSGYRPVKTERFPVVSNGAFGYVQITTAGAVSLIVGSNVSVDISSVFFPTS